MRVYTNPHTFFTYTLYGILPIFILDIEFDLNRNLDSYREQSRNAKFAMESRIFEVLKF
jgi:hypothetical protein